MRLLVAALTLLLLAPDKSTAAELRGKNFDKIIFVVLENASFSEAKAEPFLNRLANKSATLTNIHAMVHPSQGNYVALVSGSTHNITSDRMLELDGRSIIDLLEQKKLSWKVYAEDYPGDCFRGESSNQYVRKHNPLISFIDINSDRVRCARIVNAKQFDLDRKRNSLPNYSIFIPNTANDGHDTGVRFASQWYQRTFGLLVDSLPRRTVLVTTFDEDNGTDNNRILTLITGENVRPIEVSERLSTISLLKLVEDNWSLGALEDKNTAVIPSKIWRLPN